MGAPSNLPDFTSLAKAVAEDFNQPAADDRLITLDLFLGDLDDEDEFDVHAQVEARIDVLNSRPNDLHRAVVALAVTRPPVRIVTTNWDLHLTSVLETSDADVVEYAAPALPVGDSFTGLVYLHGRIRRDPKKLVITDTISALLTFVMPGRRGSSTGCSASSRCSSSATATTTS